MKNLKLNKKGFTLIELLAVIVILAIIMVVTIPTVLSSMQSARQKTLQNAANSTQEWFEKQYDLASMAELGGGAEAAYTTYMSTGSKNWSTTGSSSTTYNKLQFDANVLSAAGVSDASTNLSLALTDSYVVYNAANNRMCVRMEASSTAGGSFANTTPVCSSGCTGGKDSAGNPLCSTT